MYLLMTLYSSIMTSLLSIKSTNNSVETADTLTFLSYEIYTFYQLRTKTLDNIMGFIILISFFTLVDKIYVGKFKGPLQNACTATPLLLLDFFQFAFFVFASIEQKKQQITSEE